MLSCLALGLAALAVPAAAAAAPVPATANAKGTATVLKPLSVVKKADLDFGELIVSGAGTAVIDPTAGTLTTTGAVVKVGTTAHAATFTTTGSKNSVVHIRLPSASTTLTRVGGGGTMTVSNWTLDGSTNRKIPLTRAFDFSVGGTLNVGANQLDGDYAGTFTITVEYP